jgi:5,10-methylene-tetrahydrofolate dehydrogenase/methenyl tetrahydrofolate cyclohydrolase
VLDGKAVAAAWSSELQEQVQDISRVLNRRPGLAVVLVGNRPDSLIYVSRKQEACK